MVPSGAYQIGLHGLYDVSGCIVFRPAAYGAWQEIVNATDAEFKKAGIEDVYFPLLIPEKLLKKEARAFLKDLSQRLHG